MPASLDDALLLTAVHELAARDPALRDVVARFGPPPMWAREPGFPTLVHLILEQQVSLASAQAAFDRLRARAGEPLTPHAVLALTDSELLAIGFSRQKTRYARALAAAVADGALDVDGLAALDDAGVDAALIAAPRDRSVDGDDLPPDGAPPPGCVADPRHRPRPGVCGDPRAGCPAPRRRDGRARRGLAPMARRRRPAPLAPLPVGARRTEAGPALIAAALNAGAHRRGPECPPQRAGLSRPIPCSSGSGRGQCHVRARGWGQSARGVNRHGIGTAPSKRGVASRPAVRHRTVHGTPAS